ncbi:MAG: hypothetical protein IC227_00335 [Enterococcus lacertideformus]|uniref:Uncharacterized protein n=1 Tax=Enterococcus lacertideformus TaxID=2771493 RepID=A0A931ATP2_9ENTE|nr:hypothetical protein [Enterococcus lacertideformus]
MIGIDMDQFCKKYVSRLWIDPSQKAGAFREEVSVIFKEQDAYMKDAIPVDNAHEINPEVKQEVKQENDKKKILSLYKELK